MTTSTIEMALPEGVLLIERTLQEITWEDAADEHWRFTDVNGHEHAFAKQSAEGEVWRKGKRRKDRLTHYPTLRLIIDRRWTCYEEHGIGLSAPEPHTVEETHYECRECGERIEPGHGPGSTTIPTREAAYLDGELISRERRDELLRAEWQRHGERERAETAVRVTRTLGYPPEGFA